MPRRRITKSTTRVARKRIAPVKKKKKGSTPKYKKFGKPIVYGSSGNLGLIVGGAAKGAKLLKRYGKVAAKKIAAHIADKKAAKKTPKKKNKKRRNFV